MLLALCLISDTIEEEDDEEEEYEDDNDVSGGAAPAGGAVDLLDMGGLGVSEPAAAAPAAGGMDDLFGGGGSYEPKAVMNQVCTADKSGGINIMGGFRQVQNTMKFELEFENVSSAVPVSSLAIQLNKNAFGLSPASQQITLNPPIAQGSKGTATVELLVTPAMLAPVPAGQPASPMIQTAIKNMATGNVFYFAANFALEAAFGPDGALERTQFIEMWKSIDDRKELFGTVSDLPPASVNIEQVQAKFAANNVFFIARRPVPNAEGQEVVYFSMKTVNGMEFLLECTFKAGVNACKICIKTQNASYGLLAKAAIESLLRN